jgi:hypothetical protein
MYQRKALLDQQLISMIMKTRHSPRYIAIAAPYLIKCVPTSSFMNPSFTSPIAPNASQNVLITWLEVTCLMISWLQTVETGKFWEASGYLLILFTVVDAALTGQSIPSPSPDAI